MIKTIIDAPKEFYDVIECAPMYKGRVYLFLGTKERFGYTPFNEPDERLRRLLRKRFARKIKELETVLD